jgi:FADH2 O2-dependent halogenase
VARFIAGCYAAFPRFEDFTAWSMFYFAAASYSELSRRLHGDRWSRGFLAAHDERLIESMRALSPARQDRFTLRQAYGGQAADPALQPDLALQRRVADAIEAIDVAGLADPAKRNWYGVDVEETAAAADKLMATPDQVRALFAVTESQTTTNTTRTTGTTYTNS